PDQQLELQSALAEADQPDLAFAVLALGRGEGAGAGGGQHGLAHLAAVGAVGHGEGDVDAAGVALQRPIDHRLFDEARIGDQDVDVVVGADAYGAGADLLDDAAHALGPDRAGHGPADLDIVADRDHAV